MAKSKFAALKEGSQKLEEEKGLSAAKKSDATVEADESKEQEVSAQSVKATVTSPGGLTRDENGHIIYNNGLDFLKSAVDDDKAINSIYMSKKVLGIIDHIQGMIGKENKIIKGDLMENLVIDFYQRHKSEFEAIERQRLKERKKGDSLY